MSTFLFLTSWFFFLFMFHNFYCDSTPPKVKNSSRLMVPPVLQGLISSFPPLNGMSLCVVWQWLVQLSSSCVAHPETDTWAHLRVLYLYKNQKKKRSNRRFGLLLASQASIHNIWAGLDWEVMMTKVHFKCWWRLHRVLPLFQFNITEWRCWDIFTSVPTKWKHKETKR